MSWRTVVITQRAKLDMKNGYLVVRTENDQKRVHLDEISVLMIENSAVSITGCLLAELIAHKIKTIFYDEKRNPAGELNTNICLLTQSPGLVVERFRSDGNG